jgi:hypothetical protein
LEAEQMTVEYGMPSEPSPPLSPEALRAQLNTVTQRLDQIQLVLSHLDPDSYQSQELRSERQELMNMRARIQTQLNPPEQDPAVIEQRAAHRAYVDRVAASLFAEEDPGVVAAREAEAAANRQRNIDFQVREQTEHIQAFVDKLEAEGDDRQAKLWRLQLTNIRADLERRIR